MPVVSGERAWWMGCVILAGLALVSPAAGDFEELTGRVVEVREGDTLRVLQDGEKVLIRLEGIDAPEDGQAYSEMSRDGLAHAVLGKDVTIRIVGRDVNRDILGRVYLGTIDINLELVRAGLAWHYRRYSSEEALREAEKSARKAKRGLWQAGPRPVPPWRFREEREKTETVGTPANPFPVN